MKCIFLTIVLAISISTLGQVYGHRATKPNDYIGAWRLTRKLADVHLDYLPDTVQEKIIKFTKDSIFVTANGKQYKGTWKLQKNGQPLVNIKGTKMFNYKAVAMDERGIFFTTQRVGYYEYFERIK